ncbi:MAG: type IV pilus biogenesis/stability protein PilW [Pseudomonadales bacterium]
MIRRLCALLTVVILCGCVTETTGGLPAPAPDAARVQAQLDLARGYLEKGQWNLARSPVERALAIDPRSVDALVLMAVVYENEGEFKLAEEFYQRALRVDGDHAQLLNNYGSFLYRRERYDDALVQLRRLVKNPDYRARSQAFENLGLTALKVGNREEARKAFERALQQSPAQPRSSLELAYLAFEDGKIQAAQEYYEGFRAQARQTPRSLCLGIGLAAATGDGDQLASYELALRNLFPDSPEARQCLPGNGS